MKYFKRISQIILIIIILMGTFFIPSQKQIVEAKTIRSLRDELNAKKEEYEKNKQQQQATKDRINEAKAKVDAINDEIQSIQDEITKLNEEIERLNEEIEQKKEEIKKIMNYYQLSSSESAYLEYVFKATSFTDFIYRMAISEQLSQYNDKLVDEYTAKVKENEQNKKDLAERTISLESKQKDLEKEIEKYRNELDGIVIGAISIEEEIKKIQDNIDYYKSIGCSEDQDISSCNGSSGLPSAAGFYRPLTSGCISQEYGSHYGLDIAVSPGTNVYAVADGVVVNIWYQYHCGGNMVFIAHNVNGRTYTSGYYHLSKIKVSLGEKVTHNTVIGLSGGNEYTDYYDNCTFGYGHLHLQMGTGLYMTDYIYYSGFAARRLNPHDVINFPWGYGCFSGR